MNNYHRIARSISSQQQRFCSSPYLLMPTEIDDKGLIIPYSSSNNNNKARGRCFNMYNLIEKKMVRVPKLGFNCAAWKSDILCPENALCVGSSHGWLAFLNPQNQSLFLLNPLMDSPNYIPLPPVETFPNNKGYRMFKTDHRSCTPSLIPYFVGSKSTGASIQKLLLSMPPSSDHENNFKCFVAVLKDGFISYCHLDGDKKWHQLGSEREPYRDIIYSPSKKTLFAVEQRHISNFVYTWDFTDPLSPKNHRTQIGEPFCDDEFIERIDSYLGRKYVERPYLVESQEGDLLQVVRYVANGGCEMSGSRPFDKSILLMRDYLEMPCLTICFHVYKLVDDEWILLTSLGDRAIFLGINNSYCLNNSSGSLIKGNCIYYSDDSDVKVINDVESDVLQRRGIGHDFGVFDYGALKHDEDQHLTLHKTSTSFDVKEFLSPPVWVIPGPRH